MENPVPDDFRFAVKASRYITHYRQLLECEASLFTFMERAGRLGPKLGAVLFQLPPTFQRNQARLEELLTKCPDPPSPAGGRLMQNRLSY